MCYLGSHECNALVPLDDDEAVSKHELPESARERGRGVGGTGGEVGGG